MELIYNGTSDTIDIKLNDRYWTSMPKGTAIVLRDLLEYFLRDEENKPYDPKKNAVLGNGEWT